MGLFKLSSSKFDKLSLKDNLPDATNYHILRTFKYNNFLILKIKYLDCDNFEGVKILVYQNVSIKELLIQHAIDPHFSNNEKYHSPIARFIPTEEGWDMAEFFVTRLGTVCLI